MSKIKPLNSNPVKEFFMLLKSIDKKTNNQASIKSYDPDNITSFVVEICPKNGLYKHGKFLFQIQLSSYPREYPNVICLTDIYHPNIEIGEDYHNVCLNLFDNWNRSFNLLDVIQGLIFLLYQPNLSDPISTLFSSKSMPEEEFKKNVYITLHGGIVDGIQFLPNPGIVEYENRLKESKPSECQNNEIENKTSNEDHDNNIDDNLKSSDEVKLISENVDIKVNDILEDTVKIPEIESGVSNLENIIDEQNHSITNDESESDDIDTIDEELSMLYSNNTNVYSNEITQSQIASDQEIMQNNSAINEIEVVTTVEENKNAMEDDDKASTIYDEGIYKDCDDDMINLIQSDENLYHDIVWSRFQNQDHAISDSDDEPFHFNTRMQSNILYEFSMYDDDQLSNEDEVNYHSFSQDDDDYDDDDDDDEVEFNTYRDLYIHLPDNNCYDERRDGINEFWEAWVYLRWKRRMHRKDPPTYTWIIFNDEYNLRNNNHALFLNTHDGTICNVKGTNRLRHFMIWLKNLCGFALEKLPLAVAPINQIRDNKSRYFNFFLQFMPNHQLFFTTLFAVCVDKTCKYFINRSLYHQSHGGVDNLPPVIYSETKSKFNEADIIHVDTDEYDNWNNNSNNNFQILTNTKLDNSSDVLIDTCSENDVSCYYVSKCAHK